MGLRVLVQWFEIQRARRAQSSLKASDQSLLRSHCCAAGHVAAGPGPSLRTAPAPAIPEADEESAGGTPGTPDVLILLLLAFAAFPACGSSEPDASWPWLGLRLPPASGFSAVFPRASVTCQVAGHREEAG